MSNYKTLDPITRSQLPRSKVEKPRVITKIPRSTIAQPTVITQLPRSTVQKSRVITQLPISTIAKPRVITPLFRSKVEQPRVITPLSRSTVVQPRVITPLSTVRVGSPRKTVNVGSPRQTVNVGSPRKTVNVGSPRKTVNVGSPRQTVNVGSPRKTVNVGSPRLKVSVGSPRRTVSVGSPRRTVNVGSPRQTVNVGSPRQTVSVISQGSDIIDYSKIDNNGNNGLHILCMNNDWRTLQSVILEYSNLINSRNYKGATPLYIACENGSTECVGILLENNAISRIPINSYENNYPIHIAVINHHINCVALLRDDFSLNSNYYSPIILAVKSNNLNMVELLIDGGANINISSENGSPLSYCINNYGKDEDNYKICKILLENGANPNTFHILDERFQSPIILACSIHDYEFVKLLIDYNSVIEYNLHLSPLHIACSSNCEDIVKILLKNSADPNINDGFNMTPLHHLCKNIPVILIMDLLINYGANINAKNYFEETPIFYFIKNNMSVDINEFNEFNDVIKHMLKFGADINSTDKDLNTVLHYVCKKNEINIVKILLENGADPFIINNLSKTCSDMTSDDNIKDLITNYEKIHHKRAKPSY